jgi:taurine transport system substrate-binding protein
VKKAMIFRRTFLAGALGALALMTGGAQAADQTIVVGYQTDALPSSVGIANGDFDKATGA